MKKKFLIIISLIAAVSAGAKDYSISSPDGHLKACISDAGKVTWSIVRDDVTVLQPSAIRITTENGAWGEGTRFKKLKRSSVSNTLDAINYKSAKVFDCYNEAVITCSGEFNLIVRAYNDGCAYRLVSKAAAPLRVLKESPEFSFTGD